MRNPKKITADIHQRLSKLISQSPSFVFLFPAFTVLILAANNLGEIELSVIWRPLAYSLLGTAIIYLISWLILRNSVKAALLAFILSGFSLTYGHIFNLLEDRVIGDWVIGTHRILLPFWLILCVFFTVLIINRIKESTLLITILNLVMITLVTFQIARIGIYEIKSPNIHGQTSTNQSDTLLPPQDEDNLPDIYFIILDKYARSDALKAFYKYDNSAFIQSLEELGFWVADCSRSNYAFTVMSLSSQLNMDFVENLTETPSLKSTTALIQNNIVHQAFEDLGYTTIAFDMGFTWGNMKHFDYYFDEMPDNIDTWSLDPFELLYLRSTLGIFLFEGDTTIGKYVSGSDIEKQAQRTTLILDTLPEIPKLEGPKFVHAHIVQPHPPFIFNADGSLNRNPDEVDPIEGYTGQAQFIESMILPVLEQILQDSKNPPIIILQGDHGFGRKYVTSNLLALYLPQNGAHGLSENMTLINVFPHIFNTYFDADINYLPDLSFSHTDDWYESVLIEEWNPICRSD